jgi:hypothetical protein
VEHYFGGDVQRWMHEDETVFVFEHPAIVEGDLLIRDEERVLGYIRVHAARLSYCKQGSW